MSQEIIDNFSEYLENKISLKQKIVLDLERNEAAKPESLGFYRAQLIELKNIKRVWELTKLGEKIN